VNTVGAEENTCVQVAVPAVFFVKYAKQVIIYTEDASKLNELGVAKKSAIAAPMFEPLAVNLKV
jgi:hypothetical protein